MRTRAKEGETSEIAAWGARQTLRVTVRDLKLASAVMSAAGKSMNYDGVTFSVSRAVREAAQDELLAEAVKRATERAVTAAQALGSKRKTYVLRVFRFPAQRSFSALLCAAHDDACCGGQ